MNESKKIFQYKLLLFYWFLCVVSFVSFFSGLCTIILHFFAAFCALPLVLPFGTFLPVPTYMVVAINVLLNSIVIFLIERLFLKLKSEKFSLFFKILIILLFLSVSVVAFYLKITSCYFIDDSDEKSYCYSEMARKNKDEKICLKKVVTPWIQGICFAKIAVQKTDPQICDLAKNQIAKDTCYSFYSSDTKNIGLCELVADQFERDRCYYNLAGGLEDLSFCKKIQDAIQQRSCALDVGAIIGDLSICENTPYLGSENLDRRKRDGCYSYVAIKNDDVNICYKIQEFFTKEECLRKINAPKLDFKLDSP